MENQKITTSNEKFSIATLTWNCAGKIPYKIDFGELLHCEESSDSPDIILLGFQEIVELSIFSLFTGLGKEKMCDFLAKVIEDLDTKFGEDYNVFASVNMMGLLLVSISKNKILSQISNVNKTDVPLGFGGTIGNKGAVLISFSLNETSIVCACCHLESGQNKCHQRIRNWFDITELAFSTFESSNLLERHQVQFFMGDLNFRLEYPLQKTLQILSEINEENWQTSLNFLTNREQLTLLRKGYDWLNEYKEMKIDFLPTYKYDGSSENYDKSSKRIPSWCDRILWKEGRDSEKMVIPVCYKRRETKFSDHKPVVGLFTILPDQTAPDVIVQEEEILEKLPSYHPSKNKSLSKQLETEGDFTERFSMTLDSTDFNY